MRFRSAVSTQYVQARYRWFVLLLLGLLVAIVAVAKPFYVKQAQSYLQNGVYYLDAEFELPLAVAPTLALQSGVPLQLSLQMEIIRQRSWWVDETTAALEQRYRLEYHELSRRYLLSNLNTGVKRSFFSLNSALAQVGTLHTFPLLDAVLLRKPGHYRGRIKVVLDHSTLPLPLLSQAYFSSSWQLDSEWYSWSLK
ncbi:MAG: DUF4390 domain-containing protein [Gammaproteobacteria bacterium]|nr:DUF4390 domain-containing protein [Gammaproteobacteria bacterium]